MYPRVRAHPADQARRRAHAARRRLRRGRLRRQLRRADRRPRAGRIGRRVLVLDRYEIGERQTSACAAPDRVAAGAGARGLDPPDVRRARRPHAARHRADASCRGPSRPSTTASSAGCSGSSATPSSRPPRSRAAARPERRRRSRSTPTAATSRRRWSSTRSAGAGSWPRTTASSRPTRRSRAGSRSIPAAAASDLEIWIERGVVPPATAGASRRRRVAGRRRLLRPPLPRQGADRASSPSDLERRRGPLPGQLDPAQAAPGDRGRRLLRRRLGRPLPAADRRGNPHRLLLRRSPAGASCARWSRAARTASAGARATTPRSRDAHRWKFGWMLRVQQLRAAGAAAAAGAGARGMGASASSTGPSATT